MPSGRYTHHDDEGAVVAHERFRCAPGPAGWRYAAEIFDGETWLPRGSVDVTTDSRFRCVRLEAHAAGWMVRGGMAGAGVLWVRSADDGTRARSGEATAHGFGGRSPGFLVATARLLALAPGSAATVRLVHLSEPVLATRSVDQRWTLVEVTEHRADAGTLRVERYDVADLETGEIREVHLAGDVVVAADGIELEELDGPPNALPTGAR